MFAFCVIPLIMIIRRTYRDCWWALKKPITPICKDPCLYSMYSTLHLSDLSLQDAPSRLRGRKTVTRHKRSGIRRLHLFVMQIMENTYGNRAPSWHRSLTFIHQSTVVRSSNHRWPLWTTTYLATIYSTTRSYSSIQSKSKLGQSCDILRGLRY